MRKILLAGLLLLCMILPVNAMEFDPPTAPDDAQLYLPEESSSFGQDILIIIGNAVDAFLPEIGTATKACLSIVAIMLVVSVSDFLPGASQPAIHLAAAVMIGIVLIHPASALIRLGADTVIEMTEYSKLLLPVLTGALAAQGGTTASAALYAGTAFFSSFMATLVTKIILPMLYVYMCLIIINAATGEPLLNNLGSFVKWLITWGLKIILYVFTAYIGVTGVISGTADSSAIKVAKLALTGMIPVVGGIISEASETILVSAGVMKSAAGIYGVLAIIAIFVGPFLQIGFQYLLLKATTGLCAVFGQSREGALLKDFSGAMGMVLAMTGTVCLLLLIGVVCFMKGMS